MAGKLTLNKSITIHASASEVWQALTDPKLIRQYLFGTNAKSDWKKGSPITYSGEYEGKKYEDKGEVIEAEPGKLLHTTYFSPMVDGEDKPENYHHVVYTLEPSNGDTTVHLSQDNIKDEKGLKHVEENWTKVLEVMKDLLEKDE
jgi:uncharacterized protein YndB with AHSA1/START domain